jgi:phage-related minor tail protein
LKAATSHTILISALSNAEGLSVAQQAIIDYYKSIGDAYGALMALIAAGGNVTGDYAGGHKEALGMKSPEEKTKGRQFGGPVMAGRSYIVGEGGPERFVPRQSGNIIPNQGGNTYQFNVNNSRAAAMLEQWLRRQRQAEHGARMG